MGAATFVEIISNQDPRISYSLGWKTIPCLNGAGGTLSYTDKASGTASLRVYNATRIDVYVLVQSPGQTIRISLDNQQHDVAVYEQPAWTNDTLDPSAYHDLQIIKQNPAGQNTSLDSIHLTQSELFSPTTLGALSTMSGGISIGTIPVSLTTTDSFSLATTMEKIIAGETSTLMVPDQSTSFAHSAKRETPTKQPDGQSGLTHSTKVGIAGALVGGVCLGLFGALGIYLLRKRTKHDGTVDPFREVGQPLFQSKGAPYAPLVGTGGISPLVGAGGINTRPTRVRNGEGQNNGGTDPALEGWTSVDEGTAALPVLQKAAPPQPPQPPPGSPSIHSSAPPAYSP